MYSAVAISADSAVQPFRSDFENAAQPGKVPIIEVAFNNDRWWSMPQVMAQSLYEKYLHGEEHINYTWIFEDKSTNRYILDFDAREQTNLDNGRRRTIRVVWVDHADRAAMQPGEVLIVQVALDHFMWWSIPWHTSHDLYQKHLQGEVAAYDKNGVEYVFDFAEEVVTNVTNQRRHSIRLVWIKQGDEHAHWTGEKPPQSTTMMKSQPTLAKNCKNGAQRCLLCSFISSREYTLLFESCAVQPDLP